MKSTVFLLLIAGLLGCAATSSVARSTPPEPVLLVRDGVTAETARGVWRSRGYGYVLTVSATDLKLHHTTAAGCHPQPDEEPGALSGFVYVMPDSAPDTLSLSTVPGDTRYLFERLPALPSACAATTEWTPPKLFELFAATFTEHYAFFAEHHVDFRARVSALRPRVTDTTDARTLFGVFQELTTGLGDAHTRISAEVDGEPLSFGEGEARTLERVEAEGKKTGQSSRDAQRAWLAAYRDGILQTVLKGAGHHVANKRIFHGRVGDVGYLNVMTMGGYVGEDEVPLEEELRVLDGALDTALQSFQGARAVIVDVSNNRGGHDVISRAIAARFTDTRRLAYTKAPFNSGAPPQPFHVEPTSRPRYTGPVHLVTSDVTVSAGEVFTLAMRALPNVTHVGTTTRGALSDVLVKPLPNGWSVELSNERYLDPKGQLFEARGIPPQQELEVFPEEDLHNGHARAVQSVVEAALGQRDAVPGGARE
ncbi:S41 family peptidase [Myxococcus sp. K38C18041901]|uniref:S41 family peptidase n=1 Tax=Myxococcus guangdongensis TaxID=2906760 RepID=UPI0020A73A08|nr:S41 family peptidase [Myxococcus guangdongensis]MCP3061164.1 S41 family peptidase [Myxococcus guangdongensis]